MPYKRKYLNCRQCNQLLSGGGRNAFCIECRPEKIDYHRLVKFGVDRTMWDAMQFEQGGMCAMPSCTSEATSVDHDHKTGKVRGILCKKCNTGLHYIESDTFPRDAAEYLRG